MSSFGRLIVRAVLLTVLLCAPLCYLARDTSPTELATISLSGEDVTVVAFSPDGKKLLIGTKRRPLYDNEGWGGRLIIWDIAQVEVTADGRKITTFTDDNGRYAVALGNGPIRRLNLSFFTISRPPGNNPTEVPRAIKVTTGNNRVYQIDVTPTNPGPYSGNLTLDQTISNVADAEKAFWAFDAMTTASRFHANLPGVLTGIVQMKFPFPRGAAQLAKLFTTPTSFTINQVIQLQDGDFDNWDTIIHEYGHVVQQEGGFFPFTLGGILSLSDPANHSLERNQRVQNSGFSRLKVNQLAFSEGFANFFSMLAQQEERVSTPKVTSASGSAAGDGLLHDATVETGELPGQLVQRTDPLATQLSSPPATVTANRQSSGEDEELTVMRVLWDLYDADKRADTIGDRQLDEVELGFNKVYKLIADNKILTLAQLWQKLEASVVIPGQGVQGEQAARFGGVFELNNVSPQPKGIRFDGMFSPTWTDGNPIPEFVWDIPTGFVGDAQFPAVGQLLNQFGINIFDGQFNPILFTGLTASSITINANTASWQPNDLQWRQISALPGVKHWVVTGADSATGNAASPYWSGAISFSVIQ